MGNKTKNQTKLRGITHIKMDKLSNLLAAFLGDTNCFLLKNLSTMWR